jgi:hypothetical protein
MGCCNPDGTLRPKKRPSTKEFRESSKYKLKKLNKILLNGITAIIPEMK